MSTIEEIRARLAALCAERIAWPAGEGIEATAGTLGGAPRFYGTRIPVAFLHDFDTGGWDDDDILGGYPALGPDDLARGRAYLAAHADLFAAARWRDLLEDADWGTARDTDIPGLRADLRALLAEVDRLAAENAGLRHLLIAQIALAQYADQDFDEEVGFAFLAEPAEHTAWHRAYAAELLEERLAALGEEEADHAV